MTSIPIPAETPNVAPVDVTVDKGTDTPAVLNVGDVSVPLDAASITTLVSALQDLEPKMKRQWRYAAIAATDWVNGAPPSAWNVQVQGPPRPIEYREVPVEPAG